MRTVVTGGGGFLGLHTRAALRERGDEVTTLASGQAHDAAGAAAAVAGADLVLHLAGVNRGTDEEVVAGNALFADQLATAVESAARAGAAPARVVYAGSTQSDAGGLYGDAKAAAGARLEAACRATGTAFTELRLPNLFGEHGRPFYNAVTATFCHLLARGEQPEVQVDRELLLLHAQDAADLLLGTAAPDRATDLAARLTVGELRDRLAGIAATYATGDVPDVSDALGRNLFNTYRSYVTALRPGIPLVRRADDRGSFFEIVRSHGGDGQSSFSTTVPGVTRGDHFHRRKIERFTVLAGTGEIRLRRLFTDDVVTLRVTGDEPVAVDMPTLWSHSITNVGPDLLYTSFWTDDIFDPAHPDTIAEAV